MGIRTTAGTEDVMYAHPEIRAELARLRQAEIVAAAAATRVTATSRRWRNVRRAAAARVAAFEPARSRRERTVLERNSVVVDVPRGAELRAPSELATAQYVVLEEGEATAAVEGAPAQPLDPGVVVPHAPGTTIRATTDLSLRVLTPRELTAVVARGALRDEGGRAAA